MNKWERILAAIEDFQALSDDQAARDDQAALDSSLIALNQAFGADCVSLETHQRSVSDVVEFNAVNVDPSCFEPYIEYYSRVSPRVSHGLSSVAPLIAHDDLIGDRDEFENSEFHNDFNRPLGLRYFLSININPDPDLFSILAFQFRPQHGPVEGELLAMAAAARPLLLRGHRRRWRHKLELDSNWIRQDLQRYYGLTGAECNLALALLRGETVIAHAANRDISHNTAYTHYARLKHKLDCEKLGELVNALRMRYRKFG
ncbi:MAG: hypothetical protein AAGE37_07525 [Pseudomonadota bacterium]